LLCLPTLGPVPGPLVGPAFPFAVPWSLGPSLPLPLLPALHPGDPLLAFIFGLLTAATFALWPLGHAHDVPVSALFRDEVASERRWPPPPYVAATILFGCTLAVLAVELAYDRRIAAIFVAAAVAVFVLAPR